MLGWFAAAPNPDAGLLAFRQVSDTLGSTPWYLRALRDEGAMAERLARILASSRYAVQLLTRAPQTVQMLADDAELVPRPLAELDTEMQAAAGRQKDAAAAVEAIRAIRRRELFRIAAAGDILGLLDVFAVGRRCPISPRPPSTPVSRWSGRPPRARSCRRSPSSPWAAGEAGRCRTPPTPTPCS